MERSDYGEGSSWNGQGSSWNGQITVRGSSWNSQITVRVVHGTVRLR